MPGRTYHDGQLPLPPGGFNCILLHPWPDAGGLEPLCWGNHEDFTDFKTLSLVLSGTPSTNKRWFQIAGWWNSIINCFLLLVTLADVYLSGPCHEKVSRACQEYSGYLPLRHLAPGLCDRTGFRRACEDLVRFGETIGGLNICTFAASHNGTYSKEEEFEGSDV